LAERRARQAAPNAGRSGGRRARNRSGEIGCAQLPGIRRRHRSGRGTRFGIDIPACRLRWFQGQGAAQRRPLASKSWALRACYGAEVDLLAKESRFDLFDTNFSVGHRADRMGLQLEGARFEVKSGGRLASAPVFPGTIQCPEDGRPFLLSIDAQTIGGYPRVAQVARADRHLIGQLRPGDHVRLLWRDADSARDELIAKHEYWREWLPDITHVI
jgi:allophanate hydrolase subunit 2